GDPRHRGGGPGLPGTRREREPAPGGGRAGLRGRGRAAGATGNDRTVNMAQGKYVEPEYQRDTRYISTRITATGEPDGCKADPGRYRLTASPACPCANPAIPPRHLLGPQAVISMAICGP